MAIAAGMVVATQSRKVVCKSLKPSALCIFFDTVVALGWMKMTKTRHHGLMHHMEPM